MGRRLGLGLRECSLGITFSVLGLISDTVTIDLARLALLGNFYHRGKK